MSEKANEEVKNVEEPEGETKEPEKEPKDTSKVIGYCKTHGEVEAIVKTGRYFCPICKKLVSLSPPSPEPEEESDTDIIKPPDVEFQDEAIKILEANLPEVYGLKEKSKIILKSIKETPEYLFNPDFLIQHIKRLAPRVNEYHIEWIVRVILTKLAPIIVQLPPHLQYPLLDYMRRHGIPIPQPVQAQTQTPPILPSNPYPVQPEPTQMTQATRVQPPMPYNVYTYYPYMHTYLPTLPDQPSSSSPAPSPPKKKYTVVVDGQVIETDDPQEYMAIKKWLDERKADEEERRRREEEHEMRMKKLDEEIKTIVRASKEREEEEIKAKAAQPPAENELVKALNRRLESLERRLEELKKERDELKGRLDEMEKKRHEEEINRLKDEIRQLREVAANPWKMISEQEQWLRSLGYTKTGKSLMDILDKGVEGLQNTVMSLVNRMPKPRTGVRYTEEERKEKLSQLKEGIKENEELIEAEEELIRAAKELYT